MRNHLRTVVGFFFIFTSLLLFISAFALAAGDDGGSGAKLFESKCSQCHGKDGKGAAKMAKVLKVDPSLVDLTRADAVKMTAEDMQKTVTNGNKKMPKFKSKLTDAQISDLAQYVKSLQGGDSSSDSKKKIEKKLKKSAKGGAKQ